MKEYVSRISGGCKKQTFIFWWVMRIMMLAAFVFNFFSSDFTLSGQIHIGVCFVASFWWELSLAMPKKSLFRLIPSSIHTVINVGFTASALLGIYFNMYYTVRLFDPLLQAFFGFISVLYGYEVAYALVKKEGFAATKAMIFFAAYGVSFISFNIWEFSEFLTDQLIGHLTGEAGNAQFWSDALSLGTARFESIIPPLVPERRPLMDIMSDIIIHSASSFAALIFINIYPYRLRGKYKYDAEYGNNLVRVNQK